MNTYEERMLLRLLADEVDAEERRHWQARLAAEPKLAKRFHRLEASWQNLELPPPNPAPAGFARRTARHVMAAPARETSQRFWRLQPALLAACFVIGIGAGVWFGTIQSGEEVSLWNPAPTLAEAYLDQIYGEAAP